MALPPELNVVRNVPLDSLRASGFLKAPTAAHAQRYRFVDCEAFVKEQVLRIGEATELLGLRYSAVSYVWRGHKPDELDASFHVEGTMQKEDNFEDRPDPISLSVLNHTCTASLQQGCGLLWLDRLCILQNNKEDKKWQIKNMYGVYKNCTSCIILPAGLQCIVPLQTATAWIHRSWTLQESLAPTKALVLFAWTRGPGAVLAGDEHHDIVPVIAPQSALSSLRAIVDGCTQGQFEFQPHPADWNKLGQKLVCGIFGSQTPNVLALGAALNETLAEDQDARQSSIWQCALMRTSSRPIDMVLSIMGIFGVSLDPGAFGENDRLPATVALARAILSHGGRASWLGISLKLPLSSMISTFPQFPETRVQGKAMVNTSLGKQEVAEMMEGCYPSSYGLKMTLPCGTMDDNGTLSAVFKFARAAPLHAPQHVHVHPEPDSSPTKPRSMLSQIQTEHGQETPSPRELCLAFSTAAQTHKHSQDSDHQRHVVAMCGDGTQFVLNQIPNPGIQDQDSGTLALIFAWFNEYYPGGTMATKQNNIRGMLVRHHAPHHCHVVSYFSLDRRWRDWAISLPSQEFHIGGPRP